MKKNILCAGVFVVLSFILSASADASTIISSQSLSGEVRWVKEGSPYIVTNDHVEVEEGAVLTIDPGVVVKSDGAYIQVFGTLIAKGTPEERILFTSYSDDSAAGDSDGNGILEHDPSTSDARGLHFEATSGSSSLAYVDMRYSEDGLYFKSTSGVLSHIDVKNSTAGITLDKSDFRIEDFHTSGVDQPLYVYQESSADVADSKFEDGRQGNMITVVDSRIVIADSDILDPEEGYVALSLDSADATIHSVILKGYRSASGIVARLSLLDMSSSKVSGFDTGISLRGTATAITLSVISDNNVGLEERNPGGPEISLAEKVAQAVLAIFGAKKAHALVPVRVEQSLIQGNSTYGMKNTSGNIIDARDNFWGDPAGPVYGHINPDGRGDRVTEGVDFLPWLTLEGKVLPSCCSNVIFIPGFEGSRLLKDMKGLLGTSTNQLWEPNSSADVDKLYLDGEGKSLDKGVYVGEIINKTNFAGPLFSRKIYQSLIEKLDKLVSEGSINAWKALPYDWRLDADEGVSGRIEEIERMASSSETGKVNIVTHSNGGLIAKALMNDLKSQGKEGLVDNLVMVASPQFGTSVALPALLHGENSKLGPLGLILNKNNARKWGENMPSAYNFLPSSRYLETIAEAPITFDPSLDKINAWRKAYGDSVSTEEELNKFLLGNEGRKKPSDDNLADPNILNAALLGRTQEKHSSSREFLAGSSTRIYQIAGWGKLTPSGIEYLATKNCGLSNFLCAGNTGFGLDHRAIHTFDGDGTVVSPSAVALSGLAKSYFVDLNEINKDLYKNFDHARIFEVPAMLEFLGNVIVGSSSKSVEYVSDIKPNSSLFSNLTISVHSPVDIHAYDSKGGHTGIVPHPDPRSDIRIIEENIPNSSYEEIGEGKYIHLQESGNTAVKLQGTGIGTFDLRIEETKEGVSSKVEFTDIPLTDATKADLVVLSSLASSTLALDIDGDSKIDFVIKPGVVDPALYLAIFKQAIRSLKLNPILEKLIVTRIDNVAKSIANDKIKTAGNKLEKLAAKLNSKNWKIKKMNEADRADLVKIINEMLEALMPV